MSVVAVRINSRSVSKRRRCSRAMSCTAAMRPVAEPTEKVAGVGLDEATMGLRDWVGGELARAKVRPRAGRPRSKWRSADPPALARQTVTGRIDADPTIIDGLAGALVA